MTASLEILRMGIAASAGWSPRSVPGLVLGLEARSLTLAPGDPVATWPGLTGAGSQATAGKRPIVRRAGSLPVVEFDGVDDALDTGIALGASLTLVYASVPVVDYGALLQDGKKITPDAGRAVWAYNGQDKPGGGWRAKWGIGYPAPVYLNGPPTLAVGTPYVSGLAVDPAGYTSYFQRDAHQTASRAEALGSTALQIGGSAHHQMIAIYAWTRRLSAGEYQQVYDYVRGWVRLFGAVLP